MIRPYTERDYPIVCDWWEFHGEPIPPKELIPTSTYILEKDGLPWVCLSLVMFNTPWIAWSCGLVSNPHISSEGRQDAVRDLWDHVAQIARLMGYKNLLCIAPNEQLEKRYEELGFKVTKKNQTFMVKELGG